MVEARELSAAALIEAMRRGAFYASSGVTLAGTAYDTEARVLSVEVEQQDRAVYTTEFIGTTRADYNAHGLDAAGRVLAKVTGASARYNLTGDELYVRAVVSSDQLGRLLWRAREQAWVQPVGWERQLNPAPEPGSAKASRR